MTAPHRHSEEQSDEAIQLAPRIGYWIASRSLSSGAHSRDLLARNDGFESIKAQSRRRAAQDRQKGEL